MKRIVFFLVIAAIFWNCNQNKDHKTNEKITPDFSYDTSQNKTNDFYDDTEAFTLEGKRVIKIEGEISNPGEINIEELPVHSVIVKEAIIAGDSNSFVGAYRYDGYSLYDILNNYKIQKKNTELFNPIIDLYVIVENEKGEKIILSWGEIYYPVNRHNIIIATSVARIVPSKTKDLWALPETIKLIVANDLLTERNISNPVKITVVSDDIELEGKKGLKPLYSPQINVSDGNENILTINNIPQGIEELEYEAVFYGRGRGIHSTALFKGYLLKNILKNNFSMTKENIRNGIFVISAPDGYRAVFSFSEVFNRNDQSEILLVPDSGNMDGGEFRLFPACDFFSDRAIKAVNGVYFKSLIRNP